MTLMLPGTFGGVTFVHVLPPSRVRWIKRVLVPTQITPDVTGESASVVIDPPAAGPLTFEPASPDATGLVPGSAARSGLMTRQVWPLSFDTSTCCAAMYSACGFCGENASGGAPPKRSSG